MNFKIVFIISILIQLFFSQQCRNSCTTCEANTCLSCSALNSQIDPYQRACVCKEGYYASSLKPLTCDQLISGSTVNQCNIDLALNIANFIVNVDCYNYSENVGQSGLEANFVRSDIIIDTIHSQFSNASCRGSLVTQIQYQPSTNNFPEEDQNYINLPTPSSGDQYVKNLPGGNTGDQRIQIPLIDIYNLAYTTTISSDRSKIVQILNFRILLGYTGTWLRSHRWQSTIYTNRNKVQTFTVNVDIQRSQGCQNNQECVIIADLDITSGQFKSDWKTPYIGKGKRFLVSKDLNLSGAPPQYTVGDTMYMRVWFMDPTYTKQLSLVGVNYLGGDGQVYDYTNLLVPSGTGWDMNDNSLHLQMPLILPSVSATVQLTMQIQLPPSFRRSLQGQASSPQKVTQQLTFSVSSAQQSINQTSSVSNSLTLLFRLIHFLSMIILII